MGTCRCPWGKNRGGLSRVAELLEPRGGPPTAPFSPSPPPLPVWLLLSRSAVCWPLQDECSWLCQSCCHLFALCWSQHGGSASDPEQLGEWLPSLVPLAPLFCLRRLKPGLPSPAVSWTDPSLPDTSTGLLQTAPGLSSPSGCRATLATCLLPTQPWPSVPFPSHASCGIPQLPAPRSLPQELQTGDRGPTLGSRSERARRCPVLPTGPMTEHVPRAGRARFELRGVGGLRRFLQYRSSPR